MRTEITWSDKLISVLSNLLERFGNLAMSFASGYFLGRVVNEFSVPNATFLDGLDGIFAFGIRPANVLSWLTLLLLIVVPALKRYLPRYYRKRRYENLFARLLQQQRSSIITPFDSLGLGDSLSLQTCPELNRGWKMSEVLLFHDTTRFTLPQQYQGLYENFFRANFDNNRFFDDRPKLSLARNPIAFSDSPTLALYTQEALYSQVRFFQKNVAVIGSERDDAIRKLIDGEVTFPNSISMHMVVVTKDKKVLRTKRSEKVDFYPGTLSVSIEEQNDMRDLDAGVTGTILRWGKRALLEELGLGDDTYNDENLRILSVFLESDILNIALCAHVQLDITSTELDTTLHGIPRRDYEFPEWDFIEQDKLIDEVFQPIRSYHPTSRYRMLMAMIRHSNEPQMANALRRKLSETAQ